MLFRSPPPPPPPPPPTPHRQYEGVNKQLAASMRPPVPYMDFRAEWKKLKPAAWNDYVGCLTADGEHQNDQGGRGRGPGGGVWVRDSPRGRVGEGEAQGEGWVRETPKRPRCRHSWPPLPLSPPPHVHRFRHQGPKSSQRFLPPPCFDGSKKSLSERSLYARCTRSCPSSARS